MAKIAGNSKGFTLVETAIVLIIGGLLLTMLFDSLNVYIKNTKLSSTREKVAQIDTQIQKYLDDAGHLPCPAGVAVAVDSQNTDPNKKYAVETDCNSGPVADNTFDAGNVRIGMVPTRTLNLPDEFALDAWGNRIMYAVTTDLAKKAETYDRNGGKISVIDSNDNSTIDPPDKAHYVIWSAGVNNAGAYNVNGIQVTPCPSTGLDAENCNKDSKFRDTLMVSDSGGAKNFDDIVLVRSTSDFGKELPSSAVLLFNLPACPDNWTYLTPQPAQVASGLIYCKKN